MWLWCADTDCADDVLIVLMNDTDSAGTDCAALCGYDMPMVLVPVLNCTCLCVAVVCLQCHPDTDCAALCVCMSFYILQAAVIYQPDTYCAVICVCICPSSTSYKLLC